MSLAASPSSSAVASVGASAGPWRCLSRLGSGSFGMVHVWQNEQTGETLAIKRCRFGPEVLLSDKHREQWKQEVDIMLRLEHPNVVRCRPPPPEIAELELKDSVAGQQRPQQLPLLCMEFCPGGDLRNQLNKARNCVGLEQSAVLGCASDLASALGFLHNRRIIHRDLKPENVVLAESGEGGGGERRFVYKLIDLGYAKELGQSSLALSFVGTLQYIAPELFLSQEYTKAVDYWSLGFLCFEMATGQRPFLPNMSPGQWMERVRAKPREVICIHQSLEEEGEAEAEDGGIRSRTQLFPENQLSRTMAADFESWLRSLLEWDPALRGRRAADGEVSLFSDLGAILAKRRLVVFCPDRGDLKLDYVVNPASTTARDLSGWIERDCGVPADQQLLLTEDLRVLEGDDVLDSVDKVFAFHFPCGADVSERVKLVGLSVPQSVQSILQSPRREVSYPRRKQVVSHAYFFVRQEHRCVMEMRASLKALASFVLRRTKEAAQVCRAAAAAAEAAQTRCDFFRDSLHHDLEKYRQQVRRRDHITSNQMYESWVASEGELAALSADLQNSLRAAEEAVGAFVAAAAPRAKALVEEELAADPDPLGGLLEKSLRLVEDLRRIPVEGRREKESVLEVAQVAARALKRRDRYLHEHVPRRAELLSCHAAGTAAVAAASRCLEAADALSAAASRLQRRRQSDLWKLLAAAVQQASSSSPSPTKKCSPAQLREESDRSIEENRELRRRVREMMDLTEASMDKSGC